MNYIFIDGMSGMALGLFATLIAGTIVWQIGNLIDKGGSNFFGLALEAIGKVAQISMGAGIGVGVCMKMKKTSPLVVASACAAGMIGSYASAIIGFSYNYENMTYSGKKSNAAAPAVIYPYCPIVNILSLDNIRD